jgi:hypothetical protein
MPELTVAKSSQPRRGFPRWRERAEPIRQLDVFQQPWESLRPHVSYWAVQSRIGTPYPFAWEFRVFQTSGVI